MPFFRTLISNEQGYDPQRIDRAVSVQERDQTHLFFARRLTRRTNATVGHGRPLIEI